MGKKKFLTELINDPAELLTDAIFCFYKKFIFKDGGEGVERREKTAIAIVATISVIIFGLIVAVLILVVSECIQTEQSALECLRCCIR